MCEIAGGATTADGNTGGIAKAPVFEASDHKRRGMTERHKDVGTVSEDGNQQDSPKIDRKITLGTLFESIVSDTSNNSHDVPVFFVHHGTMETQQDANTAGFDSRSAENQKCGRDAKNENSGVTCLLAQPYVRSYRNPTIRNFPLQIVWIFS